VPVAAAVLLPFVEPAAEVLLTENVEGHLEEVAAELVVLLLSRWPVPAVVAAAVHERPIGSVVLAALV
jgi:hypothetical protein